MITDLTHNKASAKEQEQISLDTIDAKLSSAQSILNDAIKLSLEEISKSPVLEKPITKLWGSYLKDLNNFFFINAEKTNNKEVYKKVFKFSVFGR
jgi:hypothetical protein